MDKRKRRKIHSRDEELPTDHEDIDQKRPQSLDSLPPMVLEKEKQTHPNLPRFSEIKQAKWDSTVSSVVQAMKFKALRPRQAAVLASMRDSSNDNFLVLLPTGGGKSLLVYITCLLYNALLEPLVPFCTIVIVPTRPLAENQLSACTDRGIAAVIVEVSKLAAIQQGEYLVYFMSPENFNNPRVFEFCLQLARYRCIAVAVDEVHKVTEWGHTFRSDFDAIGGNVARMRLASPHFILLTCYTATASITKQDSILQSLSVSDANTTTCRFPTIKPSCYLNIQQVAASPPSSFWAPVVLRTRNRKRTIIFGDSSKIGSMIIDLRCDIERDTEFKDNLCDVYFRSTPEADKVRVAKELGTPLHDARIFLFFVSVVLQMGIDCVDVGLVISYQHTKSVAGWIQEIGRAGRDNSPSAGFLITSSTHLAALQLHIPDQKKLHTFLTLCRQDMCIRTLLFDAIEELPENRIRPLLRHLCCSNCRPKCECTECSAGSYQFPWPEFDIQATEDEFIRRVQKHFTRKKI